MRVANPPSCLCVAVLVTFGVAAASAADVEILRDTWGTPHIFAETDADAMYGLGYATAKDRGFQMHYNLRLVQGRAAEVLGRVAKVRRSQEDTIDHDRKMRTFGFHRAAKRIAAQLDEETLAMLQAYSDGVNAYFSEHRGRLRYPFTVVDLTPETWTPADCVAVWWWLGQFFGTDGTRDLMQYRNLTGQGRRRPGVARAEPDDAAAVIQRVDVPAAWVERVRDYLTAQGHNAARQTGGDADGARGPRFSHAWVVGGKRSTTGSTLLVSDPQTPVANPSLFYEFHIRGKTFDARGIGVPGSPVILIGFSRHVAWGMTALGADQADLFRLQTEPGRGDQYLFDEEWREMEVREEKIRVKGEATVSHTVRETHFGPVVTDFAFARRADGEVALRRIPICDQERETIQAALAMLRARNSREFLLALRRWRFPSANCVFGDAAGSIGYAAVLALPLRSPLSLRGGMAAHDGRSTKYSWQGMVPPELLPHVIDPEQGVLFSANHRPIASFYPIYLGNATGSLGETLRSWRLRERLHSQQMFSPEGMLDVHHDMVNPALRDTVRLGLHLARVAPERLSGESKALLSAIEPWYQRGAESDLRISGAQHASRISVAFRVAGTPLARQYGGGQSGIAVMMRSARQRIAAEPSTKLDEAVRSYIDRVLAAAWRSGQTAENRGARERRDGGRIGGRRQHLGYLKSLADFPSLDPDSDVTSPPLYCVDGNTIHSQASQAYTQMVSLSDPDSSQAILPIGASEDPSSPHHTSTLKLWAEGKLHPAPLSRAAVQRFVVETQTLSR